MKEKQPLITVYIPTHNRAALVKRAIMSVINQTYGNIEIIVVDDGSSDDTAQVLNALASTYANLKVLSHIEPKGACAARNLAIANAKGFFVTGLDDDDEFLPHRVKDFVDSYDSRYSFLCATCIQVDEEKKIKRIEGSALISWEDIKNKNHVGNQIFIERTRLMASCMYYEDMPAWQDYDLWFRLIKEYGAAYKINNHSYLVDISSAGQRISTSSKAHQGFCKFIDRHKADLSASQVNNQVVNDLYNRRVRLSFVETIRSIRSIYTAKRLLLLFLLIRCPSVYVALIRLADECNKKLVDRKGVAAKEMHDDH